MSRALIVHQAGPGVTIQDLGRPGFLAFGLSRGGAADRLALIEGAALLAQDVAFAALEMAGMGGEFEATKDMRIALTGAPMRASIDNAGIVWNASHLLPTGARLRIAAADVGSYGYLHLGGGVIGHGQMGAQSAHLAAGIGATLRPGDHLSVGPDALTVTGMKIEPDPRFDGGTIRIIPSLQTGFFEPEEITRFEATEFHRDTRGNRMGVRIIPEGDGFHTKAGLTVLSEVIVPGDVQVTGDGNPFVLLSECQTTGGYPRIGSVLPCDLPKVAQAQPGSALRFCFVTLEEAVEIERSEATRRQTLPKTLQPLIWDAQDIHDLLSYQLISGMTAGDDDKKG